MDRQPGRWTPPAAGPPLLRPLGRVAVLLAKVAGVLLAAAFGLAGLVRRNKPLHPVGGTSPATWQVTRPAGLGVPLLDDAGARRVVVRLSRAASLRRSGPDIMGLAVRVTGDAADGRDADLLFATTGTGRWSRFLLRPQPAWGVGDYTTLLPLAWHGGTVVLRLQARSVTEYALSVRVHERRGVGGSAGWREVGGLVLDGPPGPDLPIRFRPVLGPPLGLTVPAWIRSVREPAYVVARRLAPLREGVDSD